MLMEKTLSMENRFWVLTWGTKPAKIHFSICASFTPHQIQIPIPIIVQIGMIKDIVCEFVRRQLADPPRAPAFI